MLAFVISVSGVRWAWVAPDADTRRALGMVVGDRSAATAERLRAAPPGEYRAGAAAPTDALASYRVVTPASHHPPVGKDPGWTAHAARFRVTLRSRCARVVREPPPFSRCARNHRGASWYYTRLDYQCHRSGHYPGTCGSKRSAGWGIDPPPRGSTNAVRAGPPPRHALRPGSPPGLPPGAVLARAHPELAAEHLVQPLDVPEPDRPGDRVERPVAPRHYAS